MTYLYLFGCVAFMVLQGFFAAIEISVISSSMLKLRHRQGKGDARATKIYRLLEEPERFLATILVGINLSLVLSSCFLTFALIHAGLHKSNFWATAFFTPLVVIFSELIPKNIGRHFKEEFCYMTIGMFSFFEALLSPVVSSIEKMSKFLMRIFIGNVRKRSLFVTKEELKHLLKEIEETGGIDKGEKAAIEELFAWESKKIKAAAVSLEKVVTVDYADSPQRVTEVIQKYNFTRYPVFKQKEIIGYLNAFDLFYNPDKNWQAFIRPLTIVGANQKLYEVFTTLKAKKENIALVLEGTTVYGMVTLQDVGREIIASLIKI
ncbi:MAG: CNNM domain-containing protein [Candidatus Omnitrophota bacterium]